MFYDYVDIYDKIVIDGEVKKGYMYFAVRSVVLDYVRDNRKELSNVGLLEDLDKPDEVSSQPLDYKDFRDIMTSFLKIQLNDEKDWFHLRVFKKYLDSGLTYEELADSIGIGTQTIYKSVKKCKDILQDGFYLNKVRRIFSHNLGFSALKEDGSVVTWGEEARGHKPAPGLNFCLERT